MLALTSVCAQEEGQSGAGSRAGTRAPERRRGDRQGVLQLGERARGGGGRGWRAGRGAARLLGSACPRARVSTAVSRRVQPSSPAARAAAGGLSQHLPAVSHTPLRDTGGFARTRARLSPHAPFGAKKKKSKFKTKSCGNERARLAEVRRLGSLLAAAGSWGDGRGGARPSPSVCPEKPGAHGESRQDLHPEHAPPLRPGARLCRRPFLTRRGPWPGGWGSSAAAGDEELGFRESDGRSREEPRRCTAAEGGWSPSTIAKNPPVSSRWRSGTSACVCLRMCVCVCECV